MGTRKKRRVLCLVLFFVCSFIALGLGGFMIRMKAQEHSREVVILQKEEPQVLFFYREDCPDCQKVFPWIYWQSLWKKEVVFINLNQPKNRNYITEYQLTSVPTVITPYGRYAGTDRKKIEKLWKE